MPKLVTLVEAASKAPPKGSDALRAGALEVRPDEYLALAGGRPVALTVRELGLLEALIRRAGRIVSREELYTTVWGRPYHRSDRSVDVYVAKLRQKLEQALPGHRFIHTHFGFGYRLDPLHLFHTGATPP